jgi:outer membrane protein|tara:strand:- start:164 stop:685 length:522 start_codon:yes stop_codon:yes gene_type:complete
MKKFILVSVIVIISLFNKANAEVNVVFIDMDKIISLSKPGASILKQLNTINDKNSKYMKSKEQELKTKEEKLISQKNIISETEFRSKVDKLKIEISDYKKDRNQTITDFNKLKVNNTNKLLKMINIILVEFSKEKSISIIMQKKNLVIGQTELDITDEVIKIINSDIKEFNIK